jgi:hypothetical protein
MGRSASASVALGLAALAVAAAGCSSGSHRRATPAAAAPRACKLTKAQRRTVTRALADIRQLRRIQAPVQAFSKRGAPKQEALTGKFLLDLGSTPLPTGVFSHLLHEAKTATSLCGDCGNSLETEEPVLGDRGLSHAANCG